MQRAHARASWVLNGFGGGGPRYAANPGLTPSFRCSLPETGCLSQGLPYGKRFAWPCPPKTVKPSSAPARLRRILLIRWALRRNSRKEWRRRFLYNWYIGEENLPVHRRPAL